MVWNATAVTSGPSQYARAIPNLLHTAALH
ncbi:hypothetical protein ACUXOQ_000345 [Dermabacter hominis]